MIKIIDNKKVDMTNDEYNMYLDIVKSYTTPTNRGEEMFMDLFESDDDGLIYFIKPPSKRFSSLEVFLFVITLFQHQRARFMQSQLDDLTNQVKNKLSEWDEVIKKVNENISTNNG